MNAAVELPSRPGPSREETLVQLVAVALGLLVLGPLGVFGSLWLAARWERIPSRRARAGWATLAILGLVSFLSAWPRVLAAYAAGFDLAAAPASRVTAGWLVAWGYALLLVPLTALLVLSLQRLRNWLREPTLQEQLVAEEAWLAKRDARLSGRAAGESGTSGHGRWPRPGPQEESTVAARGITDSLACCADRSYARRFYDQVGFNWASV